MTEELHPQLRAALAHRMLAAAMHPARFYSTREAAIGTSSYDVLLRSRGPLGVMPWQQRQNAILTAGVLMGVVGKDANGNFHMVGGQ